MRSTVVRAVRTTGIDAMAMARWVVVRRRAGRVCILCSARAVHPGTRRNAQARSWIRQQRGAHRRAPDQLALHISPLIHLPVTVSLAVIIAVAGGAVAASLWRDRARHLRHPRNGHEGVTPDRFNHAIGHLPSPVDRQQQRCHDQTDRECPSGGPGLDVPPGAPARRDRLSGAP